MRVVAVLLTLGLLACCGSEPATTPSPSPTGGASIDDCLVDGRSIEFERGLRAKMISEDSTARLSTLEFEFARTSHALGSTYEHHVAYVANIAGRVELMVYASGMIDAATCSATIEQWEW